MASGNYTFIPERMYKWYAFYPEGKWLTSSTYCIFEEKQFAISPVTNELDHLQVPFFSSVVQARPLILYTWIP